jgi:hypothetical protein
MHSRRFFDFYFEMQIGCINVIYLCQRVRTGAYIGTKALQGLYNSKLQECNRRVDDMIVLLLGSTFKRTFTERELIEHYNYPTTTDDELLDWRTDNL